LALSTITVDDPFDDASFDGMVSDPSDISRRLPKAHPMLVVKF
jgi:hypothetical protein